mmetsp:Transcript_93991/g.271701  ORF Transcript_93991/g.271701 Transcript_93991/m.271701 type:complete len:214 (+) Transcript_93991:537-1178(+)
MINLAEVVPHPLERLHDVCRQDAGGDQPLGALAVTFGQVASPQGVHRVEEHIDLQVVTALAPHVRHGVQVANAANQPLLRLDAPSDCLQLFRGVLLLKRRDAPLVLDGVDDEPARLLFDLDQLGDVLVLEGCPSVVHRDESVTEVRSRWAVAPLWLPRRVRPTLEHRTEVPPRLLQRLRAAHSLRAELEFVAIDPNRCILLEPRFEDVDAVVP